MNTTEILTQRNIELSTEFSRYLFEHPELEKKIPLDAELILLPEFDPELKAHNLTLGRELESHGEKVIYVSLANMKPKTFSRIEGLAVAP